MSTTKLFRAGLIATVGAATLALTANAQSRYGSGSVYEYESGRNCGDACVPSVATPSTSRYGAPVAVAPTYAPAPVYNPAPVYVDCVQAGTCAPQPSVVYSQPAPVQSYVQPTQSYTQSVQAAPPANCPSGTTAQPDGTCMQTGSSFSSSSTYSEPTTSYSTGSTYSEPSYSSSSSFSSEPVNCPAGTTAQPDGTCMQGGSSSFVGSSIELYQGDAATSAGSSTSYGYGSDATYGASDYLPIRK